MYAYCANNPVMAVDPSGNFILSTFLLSMAAGAIAGALIGGMYGGLTAAINGQNVGYGILTGFFGGLVTGAAAGAASYLFLPLFGVEKAAIAGLTVAHQVILGTSITFAGGFVGGFGMDIATQNYNGTEKIDFVSAIFSGLQWGLLNIANSFASGALGELSFAATIVTNMAYNTIFGAAGLLIDELRNIGRTKQNGANLIYGYTL